MESRNVPIGSELLVVVPRLTSPRQRPLAPQQPLPSRRATLSLRTKAVLVVLLPSLAFLGSGVGWLVAEQSARGWDAQVARNVALQRNTSDLLQQLIDAETGVRGYVTLHDPTFLEPEDAARIRIPPLLRQLRSGVTSPFANAAVQRLEVLASRELADLAELEDLATMRAADATRIAQLFRSGKALMDQIRYEQAGLVALEQHTADSARQEHLASVHRLNLMSGVLLLLGLLAGVGASSLLMGRIVSRVRRAERRAQALAEGLPVAAPGRISGDEVGSLEVALARAAELIVEERRRFALALDVGRINVWTVNDAGDMTVHGDRSSEYGTTHESALVFFNDHDAQVMRDVVADVLRDGSPREYEIENHQDRRRFAGRATRVSDTEVLGASIDVTSLRRAQDRARQAEALRAAEALAASEQRARHNAATLGSAGEGILTLDANGVCSSANPAAARMLGYEVHELVGRSLHPLIHHSRPDGSPYPDADCPMTRTLHTLRSHRVEDETFWRRDGSRLPVEYTVSPLAHETAPGGGAVLTFTDATARRNTSEQLEREAAALRTAITDHQMVLHYQPKVHLATGEVHSVEALVRWKRGATLVYPDAFIDMAEQSGVIADLTSWVLSEASAQAAAWRDEGLDLRVAVNLSGASLSNDHVVQRLVSATEAHGLQPVQIEVELTETAVAADPDAAIRTLTELARLGVHRAIDDFGTGYSSMSYLKHLPLSELKIDKSFIMNMPQDSRDQAIVQATINMARSLNLITTAEGIENATVADMTASIHCDFGQGYHWSKPLPGAALTRWTRAHDQSLSESSTSAETTRT